ncbi:unnamed protein product, partial [Staurois parvus]
MDPFSTEGWSGIWLGRMKILRPHVVGNDPAGQSNDDPDEPPQGTGKESQGLQGWKSSSQETQGSTHSV